MLCQLLLLAMLSASASALSVPEFKTIPVPSIPDALNVIPPNNVLPNILLNPPLLGNQSDILPLPTILPSSAIEEIRILGQFASVSSCDPTEWQCGSRCESATAGTNFGKEFYDPVTGAYAYVAVNERYQRIIIAFRGTVNFEGLVQDIRIFQTPVGWLDNKNVKVHIGFLSCYNALRNDVAQEVQKFIQAYPQYTLTFLGHSLGGAVATLAALDARYTMPQMEQQLVTFGAPRVGNPEFAKLANQQLYRPANDRTGGFLPTSIRVVHYKDLVPHLPFSWMGYQQHGPEVWIPMYDVMDALLCNPYQGQESRLCANARLPYLDFYLHSNFFGITVGYSEQCIAPSRKIFRLTLDPALKRLNETVFSAAYLLHQRVIHHII